MKTQTIISTSESEPVLISQTSNGLLASNYKTLVRYNYRATASKSIFGVRQRIKSSRFYMDNPLTFVLRLSVFASLLLMIF